MFQHNGKKCKYCGKLFSAKHSLKIHVLIHEGDQTRKCDICGTSFVSDIRFRQHFKRTHVVENKQCEFCDQGPVVQSVVSLTSSLRVISLTVLADLIYNILIFFAEKM